MKPTDTWSNLEYEYKTKFTARFIRSESKVSPITLAELKAVKIIESCVTIKQLEVAEKYCKRIGRAKAKRFHNRVHMLMPINCSFIDNLDNLCSRKRRDITAINLAVNYTKPKKPSPCRYC